MMAAYSAALDFYLALYPAFVFRQLGWGLRKRLTLSLIMGLGMLYVATMPLKKECSRRQIHHKSCLTENTQRVRRGLVQDLDPASAHVHRRLQL